MFGTCAIIDTHYTKSTINKKENMDIKLINKLTGLSIEEIENL